MANYRGVEDDGEYGQDEYTDDNDDDYYVVDDNDAEEEEDDEEVADEDVVRRRETVDEDKSRSNKKQKLGTKRPRVMTARNLLHVTKSTKAATATIAKPIVAKLRTSDGGGSEQMVETTQKQQLGTKIDRICEYALVLMHCVLYKINYYDRRTHFEKSIKYDIIVYVCLA